jgi:multiple sugar transport system ATP-binding protein
LVRDVENHGVEKIITLVTGEGRLRVTAPASTRASVDETVRFDWDPSKVVLFDAGSGRSLRHADT